ncbi:MAG TPA: response regulator [Candidatus Saccharimonadales bacterium]|nr:response regulator [Candidatus Saccharimonadales bacterium]
MPHILLLEPDSLLAASLAAGLRSAGHNVSAHKDPQAAVTAADGQCPDVIITELQLAARSGAEFLYEFASYADWQSVPVIVLTNLHPQQAEAYAEVMSQLNVRACLYKPHTSLDQILNQLHRALPAIV